MSSYIYLLGMAFVLSVAWQSYLSIHYWQPRYWVTIFRLVFDTLVETNPNELSIPLKSPMCSTRHSSILDLKPFLIRNYWGNLSINSRVDSPRWRTLIKQFQTRAQPSIAATFFYPESLTNAIDQWCNSSNWKKLAWLPRVASKIFSKPK